MMKKIIKSILFAFLLIVSCFGYFKMSLQENTTEAATTLESLTMTCKGNAYFQITLKLKGMTGYPSHFKIWVFNGDYTTTYSGGTLASNILNDSNLLYVMDENDIEFVESFAFQGYATLRPKYLKDKQGNHYPLNDVSKIGKYQIVFTYDTTSACLSNAKSMGAVYLKEIEYSDGTKQGRYISEEDITNGTALEFGFFAPIDYIKSKKDSTKVIDSNSKVINAAKFRSESSFTSVFKHFRVNFQQDGRVTNTLSYLNDVNYKMPEVTQSLIGFFTKDKTKKLVGFYTYTVVSGEVIYQDMVYNRKFEMCYTGTIPSNGLFVYPKYEEATYSIHFNGNGSTIGSMDDMDDLSINILTPFDLDYNTFYRDGYTFAGWSTTENGSIQYQDGGSFAPSDYTVLEGTVINLYAVWSPRSYNVTVNLNNGTNQKYTYQLAYTSPFEINIPDSVLVYDGYKADGFLETLPQTMPNRDVALTVNWKPLDYKIEYYYDESYSKLYREIMYAYGASIDTSSIVEPTKEGYSFVDWSSAMPQTMPKETVRVYAIWEPGSYELTYYPGKSFPDVKYYIRYGENLPLPPEYDLITGYQFTGWNQEIPETMPAKNLFITGVWEELYCNITFKLDNSEEDITYKVRYGDSLAGINLNPKKDKYVFKGWDVSLPDTMPATDLVLNAVWEKQKFTIIFVDAQDGKDVYYTLEAGSEMIIPQTYKEFYKFKNWDKEIPSTVPEADAEYKAIWDLNEYKIYFDTDGGTPIDPKTFKYGEEISFTANTKKEGNDFVSWDQSIPTTMPGNDITLKAIWVKRPFTITYYNGDVIFYQDSYSYGEKVNELNYVPSKEGYRFVKWSGTIPTVMDSHDYIVHAEYKIIQYKVIFESNTNIQYNPQFIDYGTTVQKVENPSKVNYAFLAWCTDYALSNEYNFDEPVYSNITLYAKYRSISKIDGFSQELEDYKVSIELNKGIDALTKLEYDYVTNENIGIVNIDNKFSFDYTKYITEETAIGAIYKVNFKLYGNTVNYDDMKVTFETPHIIRGKKITIYHYYNNNVEEIKEYEWYDETISFSCDELGEFAIFYSINQEVVTEDITDDILRYVSIIVGGIVVMIGFIFGSQAYVKAKRRKRNSWIDDL